MTRESEQNLKRKLYRGEVRGGDNRKTMMKTKMGGGGEAELVFCDKGIRARVKRKVYKGEVRASNDIQRSNDLGAVKRQHAEGRNNRK